MSRKTSRNEPCPCGSGRKYKQCHGRAQPAAPADDHRSAVSVALRWLGERHRKALRSELEALLFEEFLPLEHPDPQEVPEEFREMIDINLHEWLLAAGELTVKGDRIAAAELLLGPGGPRLGPVQQDYLRQLATTPLRL